MTDRERAVEILVKRGVPVEPNEPTETLLKQVVKEIRNRRKRRINSLMASHNVHRLANYAR